MARTKTEPRLSKGGRRSIDRSAAKSAATKKQIAELQRVDAIRIAVSVSREADPNPSSASQREAVAWSDGYTTAIRCFVNVIATDATDLPSSRLNMSTGLPFQDQMPARWRYIYEGVQDCQQKPTKG